MANKESVSGFNYAIGMDAIVLKQQIAGLIKGGTDGTEVLIVPKKVEVVQTLDFQTLCDEVAKQFDVPEDKIKDAMTSIHGIFPNFKAEELTFQLNQIFFHYKAGGTTDSKSLTEYAFSIKINLGGILELTGIISIDSLYLAIWNTTRKSVLKQFNMSDISSLLPE
jgi:hypothetical protein